MKVIEAVNLYNLLSGISDKNSISNASARVAIIKNTILLKKVADDYTKYVNDVRESYQTKETREILSQINSLQQQKSYEMDGANVAKLDNELMKLNVKLDKLFEPVKDEFARIVTEKENEEVGVKLDKISIEDLDAGTSESGMSVNDFAQYAPMLDI